MKKSYLILLMTLHGLYLIQNYKVFGNSAENNEGKTRDLVWPRRRSTTTLLVSTTSPPISDGDKEFNKDKSARRRKVKRPLKQKSTTPSSSPSEEDLGGPESTNKNISGGDKNLALEISSGDGKYATISEFFNPNGTTQPKPIGIVSYLPSDDFVKDNDKTLGNLDENDIWLSEGHLLVLKGGDFDSTARERWKPISDFERDKSKPILKIPIDSNNPPPFPVFINKTGPPIFLGPPPPFPIPGYEDLNENFDPSRLPPPGLIPLFPNGSIPEFFGPPPPFFNNSFPPSGGFGPNYGPYPPPPGGNFSFPIFGPPPGFNQFNNTYPINIPFGPFPLVNGSNGPPSGFFGPPPQGFPPFNGSFPPPPPFGGPPFFPPLVLNPKDNETDDPSIFLPPPYDFDYEEDNTTIVPPGPFAPGLVVPPPKDFYVVYNKTPTTTTPVPFISPVLLPTQSPISKSQRNNAKRPKFPMSTKPPVDSVDIYFPLTTPVSPITFPKKKKGGRLKSWKISSKELSSVELSGENPYHTLTIVTPTPEVIYRPKSIRLAPKPLNSYVYARGKLKTLAEIAAEEVVEDGYDRIHPSTIPPLYDELGYPNRAHHQQQSPIVFINHPQSNDRKQSRIVSSTPSPPSTQFIPNTYLSNTDNGNISPGIFATQFYYPNLNQQISPLIQQLQYIPQQYSQQVQYPQQPQYTLKQPRQYQRTQQYSQPQSNQYLQQQPNLFPQQVNLFPRQQSNQYPTQNLQYTAQQPQQQYYEQYIPEQQDPNYVQPYQQQYPQSTYYTIQQPQQQQQQQQQQQYNEQPQLTHTYQHHDTQSKPRYIIESNQGRSVPSQRDIFIKIRDPISDYNAETVTSRSVVKAGPTEVVGIYGQEPSEGSRTSRTSPSQGSFYSFQRGGPGGFSYKIQL